MNIKIALADPSRELTGEFVLKVTVANDGATDVPLSIERLTSKAELAALDLRDSRGERLDPIEFKIVNPAQLASDQLLLSGESVSFELRGVLVEKLPGISALVFPSATFRLALGEPYTVRLRWGAFESNVIAFSL